MLSWCIATADPDGVSPDSTSKSMPLLLDCQKWVIPPRRCLSQGISNPCMHGSAGQSLAESTGTDNRRIGRMPNITTTGTIDRTATVFGVEASSYRQEHSLILLSTAERHSPTSSSMIWFKLRLGHGNRAIWLRGSPPRFCIYQRQSLLARRNLSSFT